MIALEDHPLLEVQIKQIIDSNKYCSQLDQQKATINKMHSELIKKNGIIFNKDKIRPHDSLVTR